MHESASAASAYASKRHFQPVPKALRSLPPPRRNGSELQRSAPREFAPQKLREEQQLASADATYAPSRPDKNYERPLNYAPSGGWCVFL
jgi:hypothetical protein